jgi:hypothetical protein
MAGENDPADSPDENDPDALVRRRPGLTPIPKIITKRVAVEDDS